MKALFKERPFTCRTYSRAERLSDAAIHIVGVVSAIVAAGVLITLAFSWRPEPAVRIGAVIYGLCLLLMLAASAAYHMTPWQEWKETLRRLDQSAIYVKIAGTYTPFALLAGTLPLLIGIWGAAAAGLSLRVFAPNRAVPVALALYLLMGWAGVLVGDALLDSLSPKALLLMLSSGVIYTVGVVFYLWDALPFHNTIWHAFVLVGTAVMYVAMLLQFAEFPAAIPPAAVMPS
ncbi:Hly-III family protein [Rhodobacteraceae bacterium 2CG4]|uniref:Hly-III family protein n=1 Tax=Halovulum marinum TaxID=2662447 RepID=A0A6L5YXH0_9RHOB|nr:hemolysin III family protein [Halovulum marinum]MSU89031.1 Hly-III family protein [Halovulum marinum]